MDWNSLALATVTATQASPASVELVAASGGGFNFVIPLLILIGVLLITAEVFVPGGVLGTIGTLLILIAVIMVTKDHGGGAGVLTLLGSAIVAMIAIGWGWNRLPNTRLGRALILEPSAGKSSGPATREAGAKTKLKAGDVGVADTDLRPGGMAVIRDYRVDVITRGEFVPQGSEVTVLTLEGNRIVVGAKSAESAE